MELDDFKSMIRDKLDTAVAEKSDAVLHAMLQQNTKSIGGKIKRSIRIEIGFGILVAIGFTMIAVTTSHWSFSLYFGIFSLLMLGFIFLLMYLYKKVNIYTSTVLPVKENLEKLHQLLSEFTKRYFQFSMLLLPVCFIFSFVLSLLDETIQQADANMIESILNTPLKVWVFMIVYFVVLSAAIYFFTKWYLKKLYGKYMAELKTLIEELESA